MQVPDVPELPQDVHRAIWQLRWRADAACVLQRAVRAKIARARGDPWDLPPLMDPEEWLVPYNVWLWPNMWLMWPPMDEMQDVD